MNEEEEKEEEEDISFLNKIYGFLRRLIIYIRSLQRKEKFILVLAPSGFFLILSIVFIILIENVWETGFADFWRGLAYFTSIVILFTATIWVIVSNLKKSEKLLFLTVSALIIMTLMIIFIPLGFLVWSLGLGTVNFILAAIVSGFIHIISANMWRRARKKEKGMRY